MCVECFLGEMKKPGLVQNPIYYFHETCRETISGYDDVFPYFFPVPSSAGRIKSPSPDPDSHISLRGIVDQPAQV